MPSRTLPQVSPTFKIHSARKQHLDPLVALENACFDSDRLSRRNFQWMLSRANAALLVAESPEGRLLAYILVLFHRGTSLARIYSVAVDPSARGLGLGRALMLAAEAEAKRHDCLYMRLEVRKDNAAAIRLYQSLGYREFETWLHYYEDDTDAIRFEKRIEQSTPRSRIKVPYFPQTTARSPSPPSANSSKRAPSPSSSSAPTASTAKKPPTGWSSPASTTNSSSSTTPRSTAKPTRPIPTGSTSPCASKTSTGWHASAAPNSRPPS